MSTEQHREAYALCAYCPKICRFACPVSAATGAETVSTWNKMGEAHRVTQGLRPLDEEGAKTLYACTGCMRCRTYCAHQNEVGFALNAAREVALEKKVAPPGAASTVRTFAEHGNPFGPKLSQAVAARSAPHSTGAGDEGKTLFPGCSTLTKRPQGIDDAQAVAKRFGQTWALDARASSMCCGYPLYAAGATDAFVTQARKVAAVLPRAGDVVVIDPGCAYTLKTVYPRMGVKLAAQIRTPYELLAPELEGKSWPAPLPERLAYHDACHLGRGLGQYQPPRALLRAAVQELVEARESGADAGCSGGGGLMPRTLPELAAAVAKRQADQLGGDSGMTICTACPTSARMFERSGRTSADVLSVVRRWLEQDEPSSAKGEA